MGEIKIYPAYDFVKDSFVDFFINNSWGHILERTEQDDMVMKSDLLYRVVKLHLKRSDITYSKLDLNDIDLQTYIDVKNKYRKDFFDIVNTNSIYKLLTKHCRPIDDLIGVRVRRLLEKVSIKRDIDAVDAFKKIFFQMLLLMLRDVGSNGVEVYPSDRTREMRLRLDNNELQFEFKHSEYRYFVCNVISNLDIPVTSEPSGIERKIPFYYKIIQEHNLFRGVETILFKEKSFLTCLQSVFSYICSKRKQVYFKSGSQYIIFRVMPAVLTDKYKFYREVSRDYKILFSKGIDLPFVKQLGKAIYE